MKPFKTPINYKLLLVLTAVLLVSCAQDHHPLIPALINRFDVQKYPHSLSLGPNSEQLFVTCFADDVVQELDLKTGEVRHTFKVLAGPGALIADPERGRLYVLHHKQNAFAILNEDPAALVKTAQTGSFTLAGGAVRPGADELWITNGQSKILIFTHQLAFKRSITLGRYPQAIAFTQDGRQALITLKGENALSLVDANAGQEIGRVTVGIYPRDLLLVGNKACVSNYGSNDISLVDIVKKKELARIAVYKRPNAMAYKNNTLWVACEKSFRVVALDIGKAQVIGSIRTGFYPGDLVARRDGTLIVASPRDNKIAIITPQNTH